MVAVRLIGEHLCIVLVLIRQKATKVLKIGSYIFI